MTPTSLKPTNANSADQNSDEIALAKAVMDEIFRKRRLLPGEESAEADFAAESAPHFSKLLTLIRNGEPIPMILPAFPAKSPNREKTLGPLPDFAEKHALQQLQNLSDRISAIYQPGAKIVICSDGRVFADLVRIPDADVSAYGDYLKAYAQEHHPGVFDFFNLDHVFRDIKDYDTLREELLICYGEALSSLRRRCKEERHARAMYQGITRFIFEDYLGIEPFRNQSRTSVQKIARGIAYRVIQRSNAWSRLLEEQFRHAIRLSIHPQFRVSEKIGVYLGDAESSWTTPWHAVAVREGDKIVLRKRKEVEESNGVLIFKDGRPSHFEIPHTAESDPVALTESGNTTANNYVPHHLQASTQSQRRQAAS